jgi:hypothetical protein
MSTLSTLKPSRALRRPAGSGVPWATVVTLAVGLSCTGAFWLVSLTGAIGVTERGERPFATWVMLSLTLVPVYAVAVLGALTLAKRWFGPQLRGAGRVLATAGLLLVTGTLMGIAAFAASSLYDYSVQLHHITGMPGMSSCTGDCIPREQHDIFVLHVRGLVLVSQKLLLTNAVLIAWVVAMWGGQIRLTRWSKHDEAPVGGGTAASRRTDVRLLLVGMLLGAATIHAAVVPEHLDEWPAAGWFFIALTLAELAVAGLVLARFRERAALLAAGALSVVPLVTWLWSRTLGLPFGPESGVAESVGVPDVLACVLETGALLAVLALLGRGRLTGPRLSRHGRGLVGLALVSMITVGFVATGPAWFDAFGANASQSSMEMPK